LNRSINIPAKKLKYFILSIITIEVFFALLSLLTNAEIIASIICVLMILVYGLLQEEYIPFLLNIFLLTTLYTTFPDVGFYRYEIGGINIYPFEIILLIFFFWFMLKELNLGFPILRRITKIDLFILFWILGLGIAFLRGYLLGRSVSNMIFEMRFLLFLIVYIIFSFFMEKEELRKTFLFSLIFIGIFLILVNIANIFSIGEEVRVGGQTRITSGEQSAIFSVIAFFSLAYALYDKRLFFILISIFFICCIFVLISYQRASYVVFLASFIFMGLVIEKDKKKFFIAAIFVIITLLIIAFIATNVFSLNLESYYSAFSERATSIKLQTKDNSILGRYIEYFLAYSNIKNNPILGSGMGLVLKFLSPSDFGPVPTTRIVIHNELLWMALKSGIPLALYFVFVIAFILLVGRKMYKVNTENKYKALLLGTMSSIVGIIVLSLFEDAFHKHRVGYLLWAMIGIIGLFYRDYKNTQILKQDISKYDSP
jgi:hypothetical protein